MTMYGQLFEVMGNVPGVTFSPAIGVVAQYGQALVKLHAAVTFVIINMDPTGLEGQVRATLLELACNVTKEIFRAGFGGFNETAGQAVSLFSSLSGLLSLFYAGDDPFAC